MDAIYQWIVLKTFYPAEAVIVAIARSPFLPYVPVARPVGSRCALAGFDAYKEGKSGDERKTMYSPMTKIRDADTIPPGRFEVRATSFRSFQLAAHAAQCRARTMMSRGSARRQG